MRATIIAGVLVCLGGIAVLTLNVTQRIAEAATANRDSALWTLSQIEVELLALDVAIHEALAAPKDKKATYAEVRRRFDIFYSRIMTISSGEMHAELAATPGFLANFQTLKAFLFSHVSAIDGEDARLAAELPGLHDDIKALRANARTMVLSGLTTFAQTTATSREKVEQTLILVAGLTVVFMLTLLAMVAVLLRMDGANRTRRAEVEAGAAHMAAIVATAQDAVVTIDHHDRISSFNAAAERMFGLKAAQIIGQDVLSLLAPKDQRPDWSRILHQVAIAAPGNEARRQRLQARDKHGRIFPVELSISAADRPGPRLLVAYLRDLTAEVAAQQDLLKARDKALAGERAKAELLAVMSHEIRTPLNGLLGTIELLGTTRLTRKQQEFLHILESSGNVLLQHVNDVLDISRHDNRQVPCAAEPVDLATLAHEVIDNQSASAAQQGSRLVLDLPAAEHCTVLSDMRLLKQVLLNLVGNAVKFTQDGTITLSIRHLGPEGPTEFSVQDTGIGIAPQDLARIFDDFVTLDPSYARRQGGTGLGLGIARRAVARMGGMLTAESEPGHGSIFRFTLDVPLLGQMQDLPPAPDQAVVPADGQGLDVLVIEDNPTNRIVLREMLTRLGHRVTEAEDGAKGVKVANLRRHDVILMDISMPNMDGLQATKVLRTQPGPNARTPIIALTAHAMPHEQERFRAAGMGDVLIKPISMRDLSDTLRRVNESPAKPEPTVPVDHSSVLDRLRPAFIAEAEETLARIDVLATQNDQDDELCRVVHRLAGSAGMFGADRLAARLAVIETHLKTGNATAARSEIAALPWCWQHTKSDFAS